LSLAKCPANAEFLLLLITPGDDVDALIGDLHERYVTIERRFGRKRATWWYYRQVASFAWAMGWARLSHLGTAVLRVLRAVAR
jgi:hypothetical protein